MLRDYPKMFSKYNNAIIVFESFTLSVSSKLMILIEINPSSFGFCFPPSPQKPQKL
jgi:hypothetical protein